jgi:hypothetical protein
MFVVAGFFGGFCECKLTSWIDGYTCDYKALRGTHLELIHIYMLLQQVTLWSDLDI